jgi:hypothetical protein
VYLPRWLAIRPLVDQSAKGWTALLGILAMFLSVVVASDHPAEAAESPLHFLDDETLTVNYEPG